MSTGRLRLGCRAARCAPRVKRPARAMHIALPVSCRNCRSDPLNSAMGEAARAGRGDAERAQPRTPAVGFGVRPGELGFDLVRRQFRTANLQDQASMIEGGISSGCSCRTRGENWLRRVRGGLADMLAQSCSVLGLESCPIALQALKPGLGPALTNLPTSGNHFSAIVCAICGYCTGGLCLVCTTPVG